MKVDHSAPAADRNLLFGVLAVQMDFVSASQLVAAMNAWVLDKARPLGRHLVDSGALAADTHALIEALVDKHIHQHGGRIEHSLAALDSVDSLRRELANIGDADVQTSLARAGSATPRADRHATIAMSRPQSSGQDERFRILRPHAAGGLGKVSIARDNELNREVALKELHDRHADHPDSRARFLQEAEITGGLEHPGVVPIYGLGQYADGRPFYAMRFIRGHSLAQAIEQFHRDADPKWSKAADMLRLRRLLSRLLDVCNAMEYAHSRGVLHRDLKPGNIMLGQYGETLVVDWGLAKPLGRAASDSALSRAETAAPHAQEPALLPQSGSGSSPTQMGSAIGTPAYMSPEQAAGRLDQLGPASDVYSLGATLYVLLTSRPPQEDDDLGVVLQRVQRGDFPRPRLIKPAIPRALEAICLKAMALSPKDRYPSPRKLGDDIEAWLADEPVSALPESVPSRTYRWVRRHRTLVTSGAAMVLVALAALTAGNVRLRIANEREREAKEAAVRAQKLAEAAQVEAERQTERNEELLALARKSLERYEGLSQSEALKAYGMESLRSNLLEAALDFYATLARQAGESEKARADRASALQRLGTAYWQLGRMDEARTAFADSLAIFEKLEGEKPENATYSGGAVLALAAIGEILNNARETLAAAAPLAAARMRLEKVRAENPADVDVTKRLAYLYALEGERLRQLGKMEEAASAYEQGVALLRSIDLAKLEVAASRDVRYRLGRALNQLATHETHNLWQFPKARGHVEEAVQLMRSLFQEQPEIGDYGFSLAQVLRNSGYIYAREHYYEQAVAADAEAVDVLREVEKRFPRVPHYRQEMAEALHALGTLHRPLEDGDMSPEALARLEEAVAIGTQLVEQFPQQVDRRLSLARYHSSLGAAYQLRARPEEARRSFDATLAILNELSQAAGDNVDTLKILGDMQYAIAKQLGDARRTDEALAMLDQAEASLQKLLSISPDFGEAHLSLWNVFTERANAFDAEGRLVDAIAELNRISGMKEKTAELTKAPWMQSAAQSVVTLARTLQWGHLVRIRGGALNSLADAGRYELAGEQARRLISLTGKASDHYVAAQTLAYAAGRAAADERLRVDERQKVVEPLAADAVLQLTLAWEKRYLRRSPKFGGLLGSSPTVKKIQSEATFTVLQGRKDFAELVERIKTQLPPPAEEKLIKAPAATSN